MPGAHSYNIFPLVQALVVTSVRTPRAILSFAPRLEALRIPKRPLEELFDSQEPLPWPSTFAHLEILADFSQVLAKIPANITNGVLPPIQPLTVCLSPLLKGRLECFTVDLSGTRTELLTVGITTYIRFNRDIMRFDTPY